MNYLAVCAVSLCCVLTSSCSAVSGAPANKPSATDIAHGEQVNACTQNFLFAAGGGQPPNAENARKAIACYQKIADKGVSEALFNMAMVYEQGFNLTPAQKNSPVYVQSNMTKALGLYKQCAVKKNGLQLHCQAKLGEMYLRQGRGKQQCAKARFWIQKSADAGDSWAAEDLAHLKQICPVS
jgi:TPR repeat protein